MNSSRDKGFSREELATLSRWEWPDVDGYEAESLPPEPVEEEIIEPPYIPTAEEIEAMQKQAYDEAYAQGMQEGSAQGYQEGLARGQSEGLEQGQREGHEAGYATGHADGLEAGRTEMETARDRFAQLIDCLDEPLTRMDAQVEQELVGLVIAIARQLIRHELKTGADQIVGLVRNTLALLPASSRRVTLHLHPTDAELVRHHLQGDDNLPRWKIAESAELTAGGCEVTTDNSYIDATVETRLAQAINQLLGGERDADQAE
jgi:flagellar assembly protein FliH